MNPGPVPFGQLLSIRVGDDPDSWRELGFHVEGTTTRLDGVDIELVGPDEGRGIRSWCLAELTTAIDGLPTHADLHRRSATEPQPSHPNGINSIDHVVLFTDDMTRTTTALTEAGLELRRVRDLGSGDDARQQAFLWLGSVILELAGPAAPKPDAAAPSKLWGLALTAADLTAVTDHLGDLASEARDAVQPGRQISTLRTKAVGVSVPIAVMSPHSQDTTPRRQQ